MLPEITVLMPNYNNAPFLKEAIDSILNQTFTNFVFLIVDDGSTDKSVEIIKSYSDSRIVILKKEKNSGIVDALNLGLEKINTNYFIRMDGDDISTPDRFQMLFNFMEKNSNIGVCGSNIMTFGNCNELWTYSTSKDKIKARLIFNGGIGHASCIFRTEVLKKNNIQYSNTYPYMEDYDLFSRLKSVTDFANIDKALYYYRILEHNSTVKNIHSIFDRYRNIYKKIISELNIDITPKNIEIHLEFFVKPTLSFKIKEYKEYVDFLIEKNKENKIYPIIAFNEILNKKWEQLFYKIAPHNLSQSLSYFALSKKIPLNQLKYLVKFKINKLVGRK